jgi:LacI family transcriptional regulator
MIDREGGYNAEQRYLGYKKALEDGGVAFDKSRVFETSNYIFEDGVQAMQVFHDDRIKLDAIFCATGDTAATGLLKKAADYGIKIPGDIAVIGYDDIDISALTNPPLTTIRQPIVEMGEKAVELVTVFRDKVLKEPQEIKFEPELIKRDSA